MHFLSCALDLVTTMHSIPVNHNHCISGTLRGYQIDNGILMVKNIKSYALNSIGNHRHMPNINNFQKGLMKKITGMEKGNP